MQEIGAPKREEDPFETERRLSLSSALFIGLERKVKHEKLVENVFPVSNCRLFPAETDGTKID